MPDLDFDTLVFLDETAAATTMSRRYGRAARGERCRLLVPQGHDKTTAVTADLPVRDRPQGHRCVRGDRSGARVLYLLPNSPGLSPIEQIFVQLKHLLQTAVA